MVLEALEQEGVDLIFGYPGGANLPIYQRLPDHPKLRHILVRHEEGAAHMADGCARACGRPGVVFATSGPGALNLVTGLCTAYMDSVPIIAITGQVNSTQVGRDAFQESDVIGATSSVTKHSYLVTKIDQLPRVVHEAFHIATTGRPGPVLIDICKDVQMADAERVTPERLHIPGYKLNGHIDLNHAKQAAEALAGAERPVILAGHGIILSHAEAQLQELAETAATPVGTTLLGIGGGPRDPPPPPPPDPLRYKHSNGQLQPQDVLIDMYRRADSEAIVVADVGQNQIWAALWWNYDRPGLFINSGGAGTMGFALPAAIGAKFGRPELPVWCVAGEGGFVMTAQELSVAVEHQLDVKIVLLNNLSLGMVRQFQDDFYGGVRSQVDLTHMPDFVKLSEAYGMPALRVEKLEDIGLALDAAERTKGPFLIDFRIDPEANVYPIVPLGKGLGEFWEAPENA